MDLPLTLVGGLPSVHLNVGYAFNEVNSGPQYLLGAKRVSADDDSVVGDSCMSPPARMWEPANRASALCAPVPDISRLKLSFVCGVAAGATEPRLMLSG